MRESGGSSPRSCSRGCGCCSRRRRRCRTGGSRRAGPRGPGRGSGGEVFFAPETKKKTGRKNSSRCFCSIKFHQLHARAPLSGVPGTLFVHLFKIRASTRLPKRKRERMKRERARARARERERESVFQTSATTTTTLSPCHCFPYFCYLRVSLLKNKNPLSRERGSEQPLSPPRV